MNLDTKEEELIFEDLDQTHYVDITHTKDRKYLVINNSTKEDNEISILERDGIQTKPVKLWSRKEGRSIYVDHLRDFFLVITNHEVESKSFKLATLKDEILLKRESDEAICDSS